MSPSGGATETSALKTAVDAESSDDLDLAMHQFDRVGVDVGSDFMKSTGRKFIISTWLFYSFRSEFGPPFTGKT
jgi:hypothetical protein